MVVGVLAGLSRRVVSLGVVAAGHFGYYALCALFQVEALPGVAIVNLAYFYFLVAYWVPAVGFEWLDRQGASGKFWRFKIDSHKKDRAFWDLAPMVIRNHLLLYPFMYATLFLMDMNARPGFGATMVWILVYFVFYDIIFYVGHRWMHEKPWAYRRFHYQHHTTHAMRAVCCHHMSFFDYTLEVILPVMIPLAIFGLGPATLIALLGLGAWNGVSVHSGWDLPLCPDPRNHLTHHILPKHNYSLAFLDRLCGTKAKKELKRVDV